MVNPWRLLCFSSVEQEEAYHVSCTSPVYLASLEGAFDVLNLVFATALLGLTGKGVLQGDAVSYVRVAFNVLHIVFAFISFAVKLRLNQRSGNERRQERVRAILHIFWTAFGCLLAPWHMWGTPIVDTGTFIKNLTATGISSPIILNLAMPLRMCQLFAVSTARFAMQLFLMPTNCAWWLSGPVGPQYVHGLWAWLHAVMLTGGCFFTQLGMVYAVGERDLQPQKCRVTCVYIQFLFGFFLPLLIAYVIERHNRQQFMRRHNLHCDLIEPEFMRRLFETKSVMQFTVLIAILSWLVLANWAGTIRAFIALETF